jgi:glycosyltransferase involved in cell wall biosynthesis
MQNFTGKISIIIPAYNEEARIHSSIQETLKTVDSFGCDYEVIVVDDGSKDRTYKEVLRATSSSDKVKIVQYENNAGKGFALLQGFKYASGDLVVFLDADMDLHPGQIQILFDYMRMYNADVVIGSKRHPQSEVNYPWHRKIVSDIYYLVIKTLFNLPVRDTQTGLKIFKYEPLKKAISKIVIKKYAFDLEILVNLHHLGYKIVSAPVVINFKRASWGRIRLIDIYRTAWDTMAIFYRLYFLRYYDKEKT